MPLIQVYKCDQCGRLKEESNHWFVTFVSPYNHPKDNGMISVVTLETAKTATFPVEAKTICGRECVQKVVESFMEAAVLAATASK